MTEIINLFNDQFNGPVTVPMILTSLLAAFLCACIIDIVYRKTFTGVVYNRSNSLTMFLLAMITAMIIRTINSNLSLSLGMVGALSIVRFRTAVKEPVDIAFMFWAITAGIMSGAGLYLVALAASFGLGLLYYFLYLFHKSEKGEYLLVIQYEQKKSAQVEKILADVKKVLKSRSMSAQTMTEDTYRITYTKDTDALLNTLRNTNGVKRVNLVSYNNEYGL